ncbi:MAG: sigma-70 family RNA polymerase sigma factor [Kiritimatiellae bacterium]|nr:sigma-70 family RNA polymerase sigma factor [Kiritimatiellia bacterium]
MSASPEEFLRHFSASEPVLRRYVIAHVPDFHQAQDVMQEISLVLWKKFDQFREGENFAAWALGVARNEVLHARRAVARDRMLLSEDVSARLDERLRELAPALDRRRMYLRHCLDRLPEHVRRLVKMKYAGRVTIAELAEVAERSANAVRILLHRARRALAKCLDDAVRGGADSAAGELKVE